MSMWTDLSWTDKNKKPTKKGWYITKRYDGHLSWRAWGRGVWWQQLKDGWIIGLDGDGNTLLYDWLPRTMKSIDLNQNQLPEVLTELNKLYNEQGKNQGPRRGGAK